MNSAAGAAIITSMDATVAQRLLQVNRNFYTRFARSFSETRSEHQSNVQTIIALIGAADKILDIGCGNARLARGLERAGARVEYVGVDASAELLELAREQCAKFETVRADFRLSDLSDPAWARELGAARFDAIAALAVLHHLPGVELRARVLRDLAERLAPHGQIILTNWQFREDARMRKKIAAWDLVGVDEQGVDPGDALLVWKRGGVGYRYCHQFDPAEIAALAQRAGLRATRQWIGERGLNLYSVLEII
ncbi:MAG: class I SAM-dependent methyltransferase [Chloroflexi bacterium]|nr:class I SAM-dependent methyltransferase [Chloroflexota bacterium]